jgi:hypothetical protein
MNKQDIHQQVYNHYFGFLCRGGNDQQQSTGGTGGSGIGDMLGT